jgi:hypothetical protein
LCPIQPQDMPWDYDKTILISLLIFATLFILSFNIAYYDSCERNISHLVSNDTVSRGL